MQEESLLQEIKNALDEDAPRLAYADWLESNGQPERAELIRVQCRLATKMLSDEERASLQKTENLLLDEHAWKWAEAYGSKISTWCFRRGLIELVEISLEQEKEAILTIGSCDGIRHLRDTGQFCELQGFIDALPELNHLTGLEFWYLYAFEDELVDQMLQSPALKNLRTLILHHDRNGNLVHEQVIIDGLCSPYRSRIENLAVNVDCSWRGPSNSILEAIANSPFLRNLKKLNLSNAGDTGNNPQLNCDVIEQLAFSKNLAQLEELDLRSIHCSEDVWNSILNMPQLPKLKKLWLNDSTEIPTGENWTPVVGYLPEMEDWRQQFNRLGIKEIDWDTRRISPEKSQVERLFTWEQRREQPILKIADYVIDCRYRELESDFHQMCTDLAGQNTANEIAALDFAEWGKYISPIVEDVVSHAKNENQDAIVMRLRHDLNWGGTLGAHVKYNPGEFDPDLDPNKPFKEYSYTIPEYQRQIAKFEKASRVFKRNPVTDRTQPDVVLAYLLARFTTAFHRALIQFDFDQRVFISFMLAVFRIR